MSTERAAVVARFVDRQADLEHSIAGGRGYLLMVGSVPHETLLSESELRGSLATNAGIADDIEVLVVNVGRAYEFVRDALARQATEVESQAFSGSAAGD